MKPHGAPCRSGAKIEASGMAFPRPKTPNAAKRTPQAATGGRSDTTDIFPCLFAAGLNNDRDMERKIQRFETLRTCCRKALPIYGAGGSNSYCGKEVVSYRFTDLLSYRRVVVLHRRLTAAGQYVLLSLALQIFNAFCQRISNEL